MVKFTQRDMAIIAGLAGVADFLTEGRFSAPVARALKRVFIRGAPIAARGTAAFIPAAVGTGRMIAMRHPYLTGAAALYVGYQEREKIRDLINQGYDIVEPVVAAGLERTAPGRQELFESMQPRPAPFIPSAIERFRPKRKKSAFNKAVSKGMKAVKGSTSYGKRGVITNAKKAFSMVAKVASAKKKKKKAPKSGIRRKVWSAIGRYV